MATQPNQDYFRSVSSESTTYMMVPASGRRESPSKLWLAMVVIVVVVLQIASTTGLFLYLNMSLSQVSGLFCSSHALFNLLQKKLPCFNPSECNCRHTMQLCTHRVLLTSKPVRSRFWCLLLYLYTHFTVHLQSGNIYLYIYTFFFFFYLTYIHLQVIY